MGNIAMSPSGEMYVESPYIVNEDDKLFAMSRRNPAIQSRHILASSRGAEVRFEALSFRLDPLRPVRA
jgi:hypothetical protein